MSIVLVSSSFADLESSSSSNVLMNDGKLISDTAFISWLSCSNEFVLMHSLSDGPLAFFLGKMTLLNAGIGLHICLESFLLLHWKSHISPKYIIKIIIEYNMVWSIH